MKKQLLLNIFSGVLLLATVQLSAQISINTDGSSPNNSAILDVKSTTQGLLVPRMTQIQIALISAPANGLIVYCTTDDKFYVYISNANSWKEILYGSGTIVPANVPLVTTSPATVLSSSTAISGGDVVSEGNSAVIARGVCWNTSSNPTINDSHTNDGNGIGLFTSNLAGLTPNTIYYLRAYASNGFGTSYGSEVIINTTFYVGANYGGGTIFYVDASGQHGLISSPTLEIRAFWGCNGSFIQTSTSFGSGQANTTAIVNGCGESNCAARICDDLVLDGYDDWFLPSKEELHVRCISIENPNLGFVHWSSSQYDANNAWVEQICNQFYMTKNFWYVDQGYFMAVRAF